MVHLLLAVIYLSFISLGLPDSLLGSAWPSMYGLLSVPISYAGIISMIIAMGTILSSLQSDRLTKKLGTGMVTALSVAITAAALFGFSVSRSFPALCLWAVPYGLGAGSVDASLNNYVALHYESRHMSWLHCMWGVGASLGPYVMGYAIAGGLGWNMGYRFISLLQIALTLVLILSLPLWKKRSRPSAEAVFEKAKREETAPEAGAPGKTAAGTEAPLSLREILRIRGTREIMITFLCYCALEQTTGLWGSSYLALHHGIPSEAAASFAGLFFLGITIGRAAGGFLTIALNDAKMVRLGQFIILTGIAALLIPGGDGPAKLGLILIGLGCAPIYPSIIHATPLRFGAEQSQAIIGVQMASAYIGSCFAPPIFGFIAGYTGISLFPVYLLAVLILMTVMHEQTLKKTAAAGIPGAAVRAAE